MLEGPGWHAWSLLSDGFRHRHRAEPSMVLPAVGSRGWVGGGRAAGAQELCVLAEIPYLSDSQFPR